MRAGEKMTFAIPSHFLWQQLYPNEGAPADLARLKKLSAKVKVTFVKAGGATTSTTVSTNNSFSGTQTYDLAALTTQFSVNKKATSIRFEIAISDAADADEEGDRPLGRARRGPRHRRHAAEQDGALRHVGLEPARAHPRGR